MMRSKAEVRMAYYGNKEENMVKKQNHNNTNLWLLTMKAYFAMNPSLYEEKNKILAFLDKMDIGCGKSFAERWLMKCANENVKDKDWTFAKIKANFIAKSIPFDHASKT